MVNYSYRMISISTGWVARCNEISAEGIGTTKEEAITSLRLNLEERLRSDEGVAPPSQPAPAIPIVLRLDDSAENLSPFGPGEPATDHAQETPLSERR
jgi:hypothetical protein